MAKLWAPLIQKERRLAPREDMKSRPLKRLRSTKGKGDRTSTAINRPRQSRLRKSHPHKGGIECLPTSLRKRSRAVTRIKRRRAPQTSNRTFLADPFFSKTFEERKIPMTPMGRFIKNSYRHPKCSTKNPPRIGPAKNPAEMTEPRIPNA